MIYSIFDIFTIILTYLKGVLQISLTTVMQSGLLEVCNTHSILLVIGMLTFVPGHDYMAAVAQGIESAQSEILILDWWLNPELYLIRPGTLHEKWRLDRCLARAAARGCDVRVIVYKEVKSALSLKSIHTKHALEKLHPNIKVMRHPDHGALEGMNVTLFWAHHEKMMLIDRRVGFMGGIDLCFGRWDLNYHPIADIHPGFADAQVFGGEEYNNARFQDFKDVSQPFFDSVDRAVVPRMGWHDVAIQINGPACVSLEQHFIERWEFLRVFKYLSRPKYIPMKIGAIEHEPISNHPHFDQINAKFNQQFSKLGLSNQDPEEPLNQPNNYTESFAVPENDVFRQTFLPHPESPESFKGDFNAQLCRSISDWSHGFLVENSVQNAYIGMILDARHSIYMENQFFIAGGENLKVERFHNKVGDAIVERILRAARSNERFKVFVFIPALPGFPGNIQGDDAVSIRAIMNFQYKSINRGSKSILERISQAGFNPTDYIQFFHLRSYDRILPRPPNNNFMSVRYDETTAERQEKARSYTQYEQNSIINGTKSTIADLAMQGQPRVSDQGWSFQENEGAHIVSELLYIHSKLIIIDDNVVLCGSANINDRSLAGDHDSEICMIIEEPQVYPGIVNGQPANVSRFATSLRRALMRKHLGLSIPESLIDDLNCEDRFRPAMSPLPASYEYDFNNEQDSFVADPLDENLWNYLRSTAKNNEAVFEELFHCYPTNQVRNWKQYNEYIGEWSQPNHLVKKYVNDPKLVKEKLDGIRGYIVPMAHEFLIEERELVKPGIQYNDLVCAVYA